MKGLKFFLRIFMRNLFIYKKFTFINIIGLAIGLTVSMIILIYIHFETSYDRFNSRATGIYRIVSHNTQEGTMKAATPVALSVFLKKDYPEVDRMIALLPTWDAIKVKNERYPDMKGAIVEREFFLLFGFPFLAGNEARIFQNPDEAVLTRKTAETLFGDADPMGKTLEYENHSFTVTGIIEDIPSNSLFQSLGYFLSDGYRFTSYPDLDQRWYEFGLMTFVTFRDQRLPEGFETRLAELESRYYPDFMKNRFSYRVIPFQGSHLNPHLENDLIPAIAPIYLWILFLIAAAILLIACLNFMNISLAQAGKRNIETGIKKVHGAGPRLLIREVFLETSLVVFLSLVLSIVGVEILMPAFNRLMEKNIPFDFSDPYYWIGVTIIGIVTVLGSGLYPAIAFSRTTPLKVLLQKRGQAGSRFSFQKGFVVLQFTMAIALVISLLFIGKQVSFLKNHDTGFNRKNLITIPVGLLGDNSRERLKKTEQFTQHLMPYQAQYGFGKASVTEFVPGFGFRNLFKIYPDDAYPEGMELLSCDVDENLQDVFGLRLLKGRFFSPEHPTDVDALVINEAAYRKLGWNTLEGKHVGLFSTDNQKEVIGVVNDINVNSLQNPVIPMIYQFGPHHMYPGYITLRLEREQSTAIDFIRSQWNQLFPDIPFEFESVEAKYQAAYGNESRLIRITGIFSILAMMLSLLGIMALSALECDKRTKEIGIRRVNGAGIPAILIMLNNGFLKLIALAFVLAGPVSFLFIHNWLENFAYKTSMSWWVFLLAGTVAMVVALLTISANTYRVATKNPVEALRYE
jgi:putative ABC transport system permease protein